VTYPNRQSKLLTGLALLVYEMRTASVDLADSFCSFFCGMGKKSQSK